MNQQTVLVPLSQLRLSPKNVRTSEVHDIEPLAHSILAQGVLQNLVVVKKDKSHYEVAAGRRRFTALQWLRKQRKISADYGVPCISIDDAEASAASLTENTLREPMHPADEFEAFQRLTDEGRSAEDIGALYGVTPTVVARRLKLANVAPSLRERFRRDELNLETLMAFALSDDPAEQERVWQELPEYQRTPEGVRAALTKDEVAADDRLAKFVGIKAYQKAGGALRRDLFEADGTAVYLIDRALVERLASEKLARRAERAQAEEGAAWAEVRLRFDQSDRSQFERVPLTRATPSASQAKRIAALEEEMAALADKEEPTEEDDDRQGTIEEELAEIEQALERPHPEAAKLAGIVVTLDWQGKAQVMRGLVRAADAKALKKTLAESKSELGPRPETAESAFSATLTENLTTHFTAALQARVASSPGVALRILAATLAEQLLAFRAGQSLCRIVAHRAPLEPKADGFAGTRAVRELSIAQEKWTARLAGVSDLWPFVLALSDEEVAQLLAYCVAVSLDAISARGAVAGAAELAGAVGLDMRDYWQPTASGFLARVTKASILEAIREAKADADLGALEKAKKDEAVRIAEPILREARWLPAVLRA